MAHEPLPAIQALLQDRPRDHAVMLALLHQGDASIESLIDVLYIPDPPIQAAAAETLGEIGSSLAIGDLIYHLEHWVTGSMRRAISMALGKIGVPGISALVDILDHPDWLIRVSAVRALGMVKHPDAYQGLLIALRDENIRIKRAAYESLLPVSGNVTEDLVEALADPNRMVRYFAAGLLGRSHPDESIPYLLWVIQNEDRGVAYQAIRTLGDFGEAAIPALLTTLYHQSPAIRTVAAQMLGHLEAAEASPHLMEWLGDPDTSVRRAAVWALGSIGETDAIPWLIEMLEDNSSSVREMVIDTLGKLGTQAVLTNLLEHNTLHEPEKALRRACVRAAERIDHPDSYALLVQALQDSDPVVRQLACRALSRCGHPDSLTALIPMLQDPDPRVGKQAAESLGFLGGEDAIAALADCLA